MAKSVVVTVILPVYNGEDDHLEETIQAVLNQKTDFDYEFLIIDSGSRDNSVNIIKKYMAHARQIKFLEIPNSEFSHGKTRQWAAKIAHGKFVVYLTQDATPAHEQWLTEIIRPFSLNEKIAAILGKQVPRPDCVPLIKYDIQRTFAAQGTDGGLTLYQKRPDEKVFAPQTTFYSDVCSATRREFLLRNISYQPVPYSEDQIFGQDIIAAGYIKAYAPAAAVIHSNTIALRDYQKRMFDETLGMRRIGGGQDRITWKNVIARTFKGSLADVKKIIHDQQYSKKRKLYWLAVNPLFHLARWRGVRLANDIDLTNEKMIEAHSLEVAKKNKL